MNNQESIFVGIPSLEDTELIPSILNAIDSAEYPERVYFGVAYTTNFENKKMLDDLNNLIKEHKNVSLRVLDIATNHGIGHGRRNVAELYSSQDHFLQIDSHCLFDKHWDSKLIKIFKEAQEKLKTQKIVLTGYISSYKYNENGERVLLDGSWKTTAPVYTHGSIADRFDAKNPYTRMIPNWFDVPANEIWNDSERKFFPSPKICGGFLFGGKDFGENYLKLYPYAPVFYEEEIIQSLELICDEYDIVVTTYEIPIAHLYSDDINEYGGQRSFTATINKNEDFIDKYNYYLDTNLEKITIYAKKTGMNLAQNIFMHGMTKPDKFNYEV